MMNMIGSLYITNKILGNKRIYVYNPDYKLNKFQLYLNQDFLKNVIYFEPITINSIIDNNSNISVNCEEDGFGVKNNLYLKFKSDTGFVELIISYNKNLGILFVYCNNEFEKLSPESIDFISHIVDNIYISIEVLDFEDEDDGEDTKEIVKKCFESDPAQDDQGIEESEPEQKEYIPEPVKEVILEPAPEPEYVEVVNQVEEKEIPVEESVVEEKTPDLPQEQETTEPETKPSEQPEYNDMSATEGEEQPKQIPEDMTEVTDFIDKFVHSAREFGGEIIKIWESGKDAILEDRFVFVPVEENQQKVFIVEDLVSKDEYTKISLNQETNALELSVLTKENFTRLYESRKIY